MKRILWEDDLPPEMRPPRADVGDNVAFRTRILRQCEKDPRFRMAIAELCKESFHFFINVFGWTLDPRRRFDPVIPFVQWDCQTRVARGVLDSVADGEDFFMEKARDMGATWTVTSIMAWIWLSWPSTLSLAGSYKEERVDGKAGSMLRMVDFLLQRLPDFLVPAGYNPAKHRSYMRIYNPANESVIEGEATNPDFGRGERKTLMLFDEFARWGNRQAGLDEDAWEGAADVTLTRVALSTPQGAQNHYYRLRENWRSGRMRGDAMEFFEHPAKGVGAFQDRLTREFGGPYLDLAARKRSKRFIEQELLIQYHGGGSPAFPKAARAIEDRISELKSACGLDRYGTPSKLKLDRRCTEPGKMVVGSSPATDAWLSDGAALAQRFVDQRSFEGTPGLLWEFEAPQVGWRNLYVISSDQSEGLEGGDFATVCVVRRPVGDEPAKQVAAWRGRENSNTVAEIMHWLWKRYGGGRSAYYAPEANAIGQATVLRLQEIHKGQFGRIVYRTETIGRDGRVTAQKPGFVTTRRTKPAMVDRVDMLLRAGWVELNCLQTAVELFGYERRGSAYACPPPLHDDAAIAFCIAVVAASSDQFAPPKKVVQKQVAAGKLVSPFDRRAQDRARARSEIHGRDRWMLV